MKDKLQIPLDVLAYWYKSAKKCIENYNPDTKCTNPRYEDRRKEGYEMALKTVEILKNTFENLTEIEIIKKENTNNE